MCPMTTDVLYEIVRMHRDRMWDEQNRRFGEWEPADAQKDAAPHGDPHRWWYLQGKAEAYAAIMSELESLANA
jgi:hypothetical protein